QVFHHSTIRYPPSVESSTTPPLHRPPTHRAKEVETKKLEYAESTLASSAKEVETKKLEYA
ncbi:unnamed protein product, partial [Dovyalis caffra]